MRSNAKQSNAKQCKAMQSKADQCKAMQSKEKQCKVKQSKAKQRKAKQCRATQSNAMQSKAIACRVAFGFAFCSENIFLLGSCEPGKAEQHFAISLIFSSSLNKRCCGCSMEVPRFTPLQPHQSFALQMCIKPMEYLQVYCQVVQML